MPDILAGARIPSLAWSRTVEEFDDTIVSNATDAAWRAGSPGVFVTFVAPYTGRVEIATSARARRTGGGIEGVVIGYELRETNSSGTIVQTESTGRGQVIFLPGGSLSYFGGADKAVLVGGLNAGAQYWVQLRYILNLNTGGAEIRSRRIRVSPKP